MVTVRVKRVVAVMTGFGGKLGGEDGQAKAVKKAKLVISIGKSVVRVLAAGEVMKGDSHHGVSKGGEVGADMGRSGGRGGKEVIVGFLDNMLRFQCGLNCISCTFMLH